jgi:hypothetical protein
MSMQASPPPAALEALRVDNDRHLVQSALAAILIPTAFLAALDLAGINPAATSFASRLLSRGFSLALPLVGLWWIRGANTREELSRRTLALSAAIVPLVGALYLQHARGSVMLLSPVLLVLVVMYGAMPNSLGRQVGPPLVLLVVLAAIRVWWLNGHSDAGLAVDLIVLVFVNLTGVMMVRRRIDLQQHVSQSWRQEAEARQRERAAEHRAHAAAQQLKQLKGIIPICAGCKQVRTDAGEWQRIEQFIHEHSDADFSHSLCPDCAHRLYPEYLADEVATGAAALPTT